MKRNRYILIVAAIALCGCEPTRGIVSEKDVSPFVNLECIDTTLRTAFEKMERWDYVDDGGTYPKGTLVRQFAYYRSEDGRAAATLHVGLVGNEMRIRHSFTGGGSELPQEDFPPAMRAMRKVEQLLEATCGLDLSGMKLKAVGQSVEALE